MPGLSGRFSTVVKAKTSKLLDKAEDPAETLDYSYERQVESLPTGQEGDRRRRDSKKRMLMQSAGLVYILPPADLSPVEARTDFTGEGLIPDAP